MKLDPVPLAGLPPVDVHANVYGVVPPVPAAVSVIAVPTVPDVGPVIVTARDSGAIVTVADVVAVNAGFELSVATTVMVTDPFRL